MLAKFNVRFLQICTTWTSDRIEKHLQQTSLAVTLVLKETAGTLFIQKMVTEFDQSIKKASKPARNQPFYELTTLQWSDYL